MRVLIADDHEAVRRGVSSILETRENMKVYEACDGKEAVTKALLEKPDLVILDIKMPEQDGFKTTKQLKFLLPDTPILLFSIYSDDATMRKAKEVGADGYVGKNQAVRTLLVAVDALMQGQSFGIS